ncbi:hypothetical protein [uncultured Oxalicibacterium sp.]|uniref:hypothetical protein n=1 Tax=uncultured Oxalicibacterium sp. TaxID=1168540 RepID=UPI0025EFB11A|nr:hypothetical protein [uncultured Oxalicibacterium sp.]
MAKETLDLDKTLQADRRTDIGHGTAALGPSDRSDSGSDMTGLVDFDSDTDSTGTGERASVNMRETGQAEDIDSDRIDAGSESVKSIEEEIDEDSGVPEGRVKPKPEVEI